MSHYIEYCSKCRKVIATCRCPSKDKEVWYGICESCKKGETPVNKNKGVTLIELLIVISIVGVLAAVIIPAIVEDSKAVAQAERVEHDSHCKQVGAKLAQNVPLESMELDFYSNNKSCADNYAVKYKITLGK